MWKCDVCGCGPFQCSHFWGKDSSMVLLLSAGIIVLFVSGMYLAGWL
jgi:hypothetical protein